MFHKFFSTYWTLFRKPAEKVSTNGRTFFLNSRKEIETFGIFGTRFSFNCSCGHLEGRFDVLARKFMQKYDFFSIVVRKRLRKKLSELFPQLVPLDKLNPALSTLQIKVWTKGYVFPAQLSNSITIIFSKENDFHKSLFGHAEYSSDKPLKRFQEKTQIFSDGVCHFWEVFLPPTLR